MNRKINQELVIGESMAWPEPFGGIIFLVIILVSFVSGLRIARKSARNGILIIVAPWIILIVASLFFPNIDDWNPMLKSDESAWGLWIGDGYRIQLNPDETFTLQFEDQSLQGTWRRMDFNVYLKADSGKDLYMRFVEDSGNLLLLPKPPMDESPRPGPITRKR